MRAGVKRIWQGSATLLVGGVVWQIASVTGLFGRVSPAASRESSASRSHRKASGTAGGIVGQRRPNCRRDDNLGRCLPLQSVRRSF